MLMRNAEMLKLGVRATYYTHRNFSRRAEKLRFQYLTWAGWWTCGDFT